MIDRRSTRSGSCDAAWRSALASGCVAVAALVGCSNTVVHGTGGQGGQTTSTSGTSTGSSSATSTSSSTSGSAATTGSAATSTSSGTMKNSGDCATDADCAPNGHCIEVAPGGFRLCDFPVMEATMCASPQDQCCTSSTCTAPAKCFATPLVPVCAGVVMQPHNECAAAECATSADCTGGVCLPAGSFGNKVAACLAAACVRDTDCTVHPGGTCGTLEDPCCHTTTNLACVYPGDCRKDADCGANAYCSVDATGEPKCHPGFPPCPA